MNTDCGTFALMLVRGLEPPIPSLRVKCITNYATPAKKTTLKY